MVKNVKYLVDVIYGWALSNEQTVLARLKAISFCRQWPWKNLDAASLLRGGFRQEIIQKKKSFVAMTLCGFSVAPQKIWKSHRFGPRFGSKLLHCNVTERIQSLVPV